jgi:hypothetical protein
MSNESILRKGRGAVPGAPDKVAYNADNVDIEGPKVPTKRCESEGANRPKPKPGAGEWVEGGYHDEKEGPPRIEGGDADTENKNR